MLATAHPTSPSAAANAPAHSTLELLEARQLRDALKNLLRREQTAMADFLVALAEFDRRRGWEPLGHASFFAFLHFELGLSNSAAFHRMSAARLLQRFPDLIEPFRDGRLCLSTAAELSKVATEANRTEVAPRFFGLSAREAQEVVAALQPRAAPPLRAVVTSLAKSPFASGPSLATALARPRALAGPATLAKPSSGFAALDGSSDTDSESLLTSEEELTHPARDAAPRRVPAHAPPDLPRAPPRDEIEPLTADLRRLHVSVSRQFLKKLTAARDGISHASPGATTEQVLEAALDLLLEKQAKARGQVKRPRKGVAAPAVPATVAAMIASAPPGSAGSLGEPSPIDGTARSPATGRSHGGASSSADTDDGGTAPLHRRAGPREPVPAAVRRAVWARDGGRCTWPLDRGGTCGSTHRLELDHVIPWAKWGPSTLENLRLVCGRHNALAARRHFGARCAGRYAGQAHVPGR